MTKPKATGVEIIAVNPDSPVGREILKLRAEVDEKSKMYKLAVKECARLDDVVLGLECQNRELRKSLDQFAWAFRERPERQGNGWSLGYWHGVDPGLALVAGSEDGLEDSRFIAVLKYEPDFVKKILDLTDPKHITSKGSKG